MVARAAPTTAEVELCQGTTCVPAASWANTGPATEVPQEGPVSLLTHYIKEFNVTSVVMKEEWFEEDGMWARVVGEVQGPGPFIIERSREEGSGGRVVLAGEERDQYGDLLDIYSLLEPSHL